MAKKFKNPSRNPQQAKVVIVQQNTSGNVSSTQLTSNRIQAEISHIQERQNSRNQVLEQFIREAKRKGEITTVYENKI